MNNLEWLEHIKREENTWLNNRKDKLRDCYELRKAKALEIIAEELIGLNKNLKKVIDKEGCLKVDPHYDI